MSMKWVTILQFISVSAIYFGLTVALPIPILYKRVQKDRPCVRLMAYLLTGNFFFMNLVFVLQLLHISNRFTLFLFTVVPYAAALIRVYHVDAEEYTVQTVQYFKSFLVGTMGFKLMVSNIFKGIGKGLRRWTRDARYNFQKYFLDWLCIALLLALIFWQYGKNLIETYGYCVSDIPVHNYWINAMSENKIFVAGVYPYGFHCIIYYMHEMFGIETFVLLRVFCLVQNIMVHLVLLAFLKLVCRTRYMPYLAFVFYTLGNFWHENITLRYYSSLPQEFGMVFILPAAAFLILFFSARKEEVWQKQTGLRVPSTNYLIWFAMGFSMTLAVHFYNTMIIGFLCAGIAVGYAGLLFRRAYFGRVMAAGIVSIVIAVLPMGIAYVTGTPLQGSLGWGMNIIRGTSTGSLDQWSTETDMANRLHVTGMTASAAVSDSLSIPACAVAANRAGIAQGMPDSPAEPGVPNAAGDRAFRGGGGVVAMSGQLPMSLRLRIWFNQKKRWVLYFCGLLHDMTKTWILTEMGSAELTACLLSMPALLVLGIGYLFSRQKRAYGCNLISVAVFMLLMYILLLAPLLQIPVLMDTNRCSIYLSYGLVAAMVLCADAVLSLVLGWVSDERVMNGISLGGIAALSAVLFIGGRYRTPAIIDALETNGAIIALTNILRDEKEQMFTVCSANDELRMMEEYGYHYEMITFLREMEGDKVDDYLTIPTPRVYFFIEKIPGDYSEPYAGSGRTVSAEGAARELPRGDGITIYKGEKRYIVMSRMYYWAEAFRKLYPSEMRVYYETDDFVCYVVEQNTYRLFDLSIDYGFNR